MPCWERSRQPGAEGGDPVGGETVNYKIPATIDATALSKMADRGQITGAVIDGPLAFDNAISKEAARIKGIVSPVAGLADIFLVPDLEAGNILAKQLTYLADSVRPGWSWAPGCPSSSPAGPTPPNRGSLPAPLQWPMPTVRQAR